MCVSNLNPKLVLTIKHRPEQVLPIKIDSSTSNPVVNIDAVKIDLVDWTGHLQRDICIVAYLIIYTQTFIGNWNESICIIPNYVDILITNWGCLDISTKIQTTGLWGAGIFAMFSYVVENLFNVNNICVVKT